jgi:hypothetical protein
MEFTIDLKQVFKQNFGYDVPEQFNVEQYSGRTLYSKLGSPFFKADIYGREFFMPVVLDGVLLPFAVVGIRLRKTIVKTSLVERDGTVKEIISSDDYEISVKGIAIYPDGDVFPEDEIMALKKIYEKNQAVVLQCAMTDIFIPKDDSVVMEDLTFPPVSGVEHARPYEMSLLSDRINTLELFT